MIELRMKIEDTDEKYPQIQKLLEECSRTVYAVIANNICYVDPTSDGLLAYWRCNEGTGKAIKD